MNRYTAIAAGVLMGLSSVARAGGLIPFRILETSQNAPIKYSVDVEVPLVDGRLPNVEELGAVSEHLAGDKNQFERRFVTFFLPGMKVGHGAFATAHHNPQMEVERISYMLIQYPQYHEFLNTETWEFKEP